MRITSK